VPDTHEWLNAKSVVDVIIGVAAALIASYLIARSNAWSRQIRFKRMENLSIKFLMLEEDTSGKHLMIYAIYHGTYAVVLIVLAGFSIAQCETVFIGAMNAPAAILIPYLAAGSTFALVLLLLGWRSLRNVGDAYQYYVGTYLKDFPEEKRDMIRQRLRERSSKDGEKRGW
jgi:hypothetical protein